MSKKLFRTPIVNGEEGMFSAEDILTSMGISVDDAVDYEVGSNVNGQYAILPSGLAVVIIPKFTMSFANERYLEKVLNHPIEFVSGTVVGNPTRNSDWSSWAMITGSIASTSSSTHTTVRLYANRGEVFTSGSNENAGIVIIGLYSK